MTLGQYLKEKRLEKGLTQFELAEMLNLKHYQNIQKYEKNLCEPNLKILFNLCEILQISIEEIKKIVTEE